ncbi:hypothetical protein [Pseudonocardia sp. HH130629-09]|uniref:hypothetical protein n=1 Tax=Pseudonocardia sp. HH130629-09 TaxID=1641402 RepID=UPI0006CB1EBA|nr:hypothetical protein [Pseudonocardia sp. HH130629-09]ALE85926.1 hypothetical protein XF36_24645 [Pseudonocardia sp. HH130629-09]
MPGTGYACVADPATGEFVADAGQRAVPGLAEVLDWGAAQVGGPGPVFEDAVVTTREGDHHLLRALPRDGAAPLLAYAHLDRSGSPVALARRALRPAGATPARTPEATPTSTDQQVTAPIGAPVATRPVMRVRPVTPATSPPGQVDTPPATIAVPSPSPVPDAERTPAPAVPLPRRAPGPAEPSDAADPPATADGDDAHAGATPEGGRWADDLGTMSRILAALRRLDPSSASGC